MTPHVSVVVATHNRSDWLDDCLATLVAQRTDRVVEFVVVDNASTDATADVVRSWAARDDRVRLVAEPNLGLSRAKNAGLAAAAGDVVLFTDDDVVVPSGWIAAMCGAVGDAPDALVGGPIVPVPADLGPWPPWFSDSALRPAGLLDHGETRPLRPFEYVWGANMGARRAVFDRVGPWDETVGRRGEARGTFEDTEYQDRARRVGVPVWFCPGAWLQHRVPRATLSPRALLRTSLVHGEVDARVERRSAGGGYVAPGAIAAHARTSRDLLAWWAATGALRAVPTAMTFAVAHRAALRLGRSVECLDDEGRATPSRRRVARYARRAALQATRVIPDGSTAPAAERGARRARREAPER